MASSAQTRSAALRLRRFHQRKPGRLASQVSKKMASQVVVEGEAELTRGKAPPVAKAYLLRVLKGTIPACPSGRLSS